MLRHALSAAYAKRFGDEVPEMREVVTDLETTRYWKMLDGRGDLRAAAKAAEVARQSAVPALDGLVSALEDLTYQLQLCARGP